MFMVYFVYPNIVYVSVQDIKTYVTVTRKSRLDKNIIVDSFEVVFRIARDFYLS